MGTSKSARSSIAKPRSAVQRYAAASMAPLTRQAYAVSWRKFTAWCRERNRRTLPCSAGTLAEFLAWCRDEGLAPSTISTYRFSVGKAHELAGHENPADDPRVAIVMAGIRRTPHRVKRARAIRPEEIRAMVAVLGDSIRDVRDRAIVLVGFVGALRSSEIVGLDVGDVSSRPGGDATLLLRKSKTDQEGRGREVPLPASKAAELCPVHSIRAWLRASKLTDGPLFPGMTGRSRKLRPDAPRMAPRDVGRVLERLAERSGVDLEGLTSHSLRVGLVSAAAERNRSIASIAAVTGHASEAMILRYIRSARLLDDAAARGILDESPEPQPGPA